MEKQKQRLLDIRKKLKHKKPVFLRRCNLLKKRLANNLKWHKPKGIHNKMRIKGRGNPAGPSNGYKSPAEVRGLTPSGFEPIIINNVKELMRIDSKYQIAVIAAAVGQKKRIDIAKKAKEMKMTIHNLKELDGFLKEVEQSMESRKKDKTVKSTEKENRLKEAEKKMHQKKPEAQKEVSAEEKAELEKVEKDKVLTQRE
jgi:large subunit ribosomal protein L32e